MHFEYDASGSLVQQDFATKQVLDVTQSFDVVFSTDRSSDRFTGKPVSQTTGLYYYYQRWYDPSIGRFVSSDPKPGMLCCPQSLNPYVYVSNQPTVLTDSTGEGWFDSVVSFFSPIISPIVSTVTPVVNKIVQTGSSTLTVTTNLLNKAASTATSIVKTAVNVVVNGANQLASQVTQLGESAYNTLSNVGSTLWQGAQKTSGQVASSLFGSGKAMDQDRSSGGEVFPGLGGLLVVLKLAEAIPPCWGVVVGVAMIAGGLALLWGGSIIGAFGVAFGAIFIASALNRGGDVFSSSCWGL